jgi:hypothetical protein
MKQSTLTIRVETKLKEKVAARARKERRSLADETAYLMEIGLKIMERQPDPILANTAQAVAEQRQVANA